MPKSSTDTKKTRARAPRHYLATVHGQKRPLFVVAKSQRAAIESLITLSLATPADLLVGGKFDYEVIDTINPAQANLVDAIKSDAA